MAKSAALSSAASWALEQDEILQGNRYKSEVSSCADLFKLFSGGVEAKTFRGDLDDIEEQNEEDEERLERRIEKRITRAKSKVKAEAKADKKKAEDPIIPFRTPILGEIREFQAWLELRDKARKNLFWLGRDVLKRDLVEHVHQIVCDQFVSKNFDNVYYEGYRIGDVHDAIGKQKRFDENGRPTREMMLLDPRGFYKALDIETLIPTPSGFCRMADLNVGDVVFDDRGFQTNVIGVSPVYENRSCYEVVFSTGETIIADEDHLWETESRKDRDNRSKQERRKGRSVFKIRTTSELSKSVYVRKERNHRVRVAAAIKTADKELLISPYVLGAWLGDGTTSNSNFTFADEEIASEIRKEGYEIRCPGYEGDKYRWVTNGGPTSASYRKHSGNLATHLRCLGLLDNKHIPQEYLRASFSQRFALLQGLMDTDGHASLKGDCVFSNTDKKLAFQVRELIASLGFRPRKIGEYDVTINGRFIGKAYQVGFRAYAGEFAPFRLERKIRRLRNRAKVSLQDFRQIVEVRKASSRSVRCIMVDSPSHLYLVGEGFIPTHNTTIDGIDCVQWLLNAPDIRILILAGEYILSSAFLSEIKGYFNFPKNSDPTDFHLLFPEYVLRGLAGESDQPLWCPVRKHLQKEASVWTNAIMASLSGWHCDVRKGDDVVTDRNCTTIELRHTLKEKYDGTDNLVDEWGLSDHIGTRYYTDDWYGTRIDKSKEEESETALKYFCRQCWIVKPEYTTVPLKQLTSDMVVLNFPEKATFTSLRRKLLNNEKSFRNQQLNEPLEDDVALTINFDEETLRKHVYRFEQAPKVGDIFILWDTALTANKRSDFSSGVVGRIAPQEIKNDDGVVVETRYSLIILEVVYGKFSQSELAVQIVALAKKWKPKKTVIERLPGTELFQREVAMRATQFGVSLDIYFYPPSLEPNAKRNRIHGLEILLKEDRLWFVAGPWIEETFFQLRRYTGEKKNRGRKDDIADAMSSLPMFLPSTMQNEVLRVMQEKEREAAMKKAEYDRIFGGATTLTPINVSSPQTTKSTYVRGPFGIPGFRSRGNVNGGN